MAEEARRPEMNMAFGCLRLLHREAVVSSHEFACAVVDDPADPVVRFDGVRTSSAAAAAAAPAETQR